MERKCVRGTQNGMTLTEVETGQTYTVMCSVSLPRSGWFLLSPHKQNLWILERFVEEPESPEPSDSPDF